MRIDVVFAAKRSFVWIAPMRQGSGKTHTMVGAGDSDDGRGVIPRVMAALWSEIEDRSSSQGLTFAVRASFCELYNDDLRDLLDAEHPDKDIRRRDDVDGSVVVSGLKEVPVTGVAGMAACLAEGFRHRATSGTKMNAQSSRSHAIFSLVVEQTSSVSVDATDAAADAVMKVSKFHLVDLAGRYGAHAGCERLSCAVCVRVDEPGVATSAARGGGIGGRSSGEWCRDRQYWCALWVAAGVGVW